MTIIIELVSSCESGAYLRDADRQLSDRGSLCSRLTGVLSLGEGEGLPTSIQIRLEKHTLVKQPKLMRSLKPSSHMTRHVCSQLNLNLKVLLNFTFGRYYTDLTWTAHLYSFVSRALCLLVFGSHWYLWTWSEVRNKAYMFHCLETGNLNNENPSTFDPLRSPLSPFSGLAKKGGFEKRR